jgi:hypothetical protein
MKNFDEKWRALAARARQAAPLEETAPLGFATRVVAAGLWPGRDSVWGPWALRAVWGAAAALVICAALDAPYLRSANVFDCGLEDSITRIIWAL